MACCDCNIPGFPSGGGAVCPLTTKGDLLAYSTLCDRFGVGADGTQLFADSSQPFGLAWKTPASSSFVIDSALLKTVINLDPPNTPIPDTVQPAVPQYTYTIAPGDIPVSPYVASWLAYITYGGGSSGAAAGGQSIVTRNGVNTAATNAWNTLANSYWLCAATLATVPVSVGDIIGLKLWQAVANVADFRYWNIYIVPALFTVPGLFYTAGEWSSTLFTIAGAIPGVAYTAFVGGSYNFIDPAIGALTSFALAPAVGNCTYNGVDAGGGSTTSATQKLFQADRGNRYMRLVG